MQIKKKNIIGRSVYGVHVDGVYDKIIGKPNENIAFMKPNNGVNYENVNVNNVTVRPRQNLYNQGDIEHQNVNTTPDRFQSFNATSSN